MPEVGSFLKGLFFGHIEEELLFPYPSMDQAGVEHLAGLLEDVHGIASAMVEPEIIDREARIPDAVLHAMGEAGLFGMSIPRRYGGLGLTTTESSRALEEVAYVDSSLAITVGSHASLGVLGLLMFGTEAQKERWLPRLASGEVVAAFGLSEATGGTDVAGMRATAHRLPGGGYRLTGVKTNVTNGDRAGLFTIFARTSGRVGSRDGITAFLVEKGQGVELLGRADTLGVRGASFVDVKLDDVVVSDENVLGEPGMGFKIAMEILNRSRLAIAPGCLGICRRALEHTAEHARARHAFGRPIGQFGMIQHKISRMVVDTFVLESLTYLVTGLMDRGRTDTSMECAVAKVVASETAWRVVHDGFQVAAGQGYLRGTPFERLLRDARLNLIYSGTNEILRVYVALAGLGGPAELLRSVASAVRNPMHSIGLLADYALDILDRRWRRGKITLAGQELMGLAEPLVERVSTFGEVVERVLRREGDDILEKQLLQERIADVVIDLYSGFASLARASANVEQGDQEAGRNSMASLTLFLDEAVPRVDLALERLGHNRDDLSRELAVEAMKRGSATITETQWKPNRS